MNLYQTFLENEKQLKNKLVKIIKSKENMIKNIYLKDLRLYYEYAQTYINDKL